MDVIEETVNEGVPLTKKKIKTNWKNKPWFDERIINTIKSRDNAFKEANVISDDKRYKQLRNQVVNSIRTNKRNYYETMINENKRDGKKLWKVLKESIGDKKTQSKLTQVYIEN